VRGSPSSTDLVAGNLRRGLVVRPFEPLRLIRLYALWRPERLSLAAQALLDMLAASGTAGTGKHRAAPPKRRAAH